VNRLIVALEEEAAEDIRIAAVEKAAMCASAAGRKR
jgi:hypothetical protein